MAEPPGIPRAILWGKAGPSSYGCAAANMGLYWSLISARRMVDEWLIAMVDNQWLITLVASNSHSWLIGDNMNN